MEFFPWPWIYPYSPGAQFEIEPPGIYANSTLRFCKLFPQYPAGLWTLQYVLVPYAGTRQGPITFQSTQLNGSEWFLVSVPASVTTTWQPGRYTWQCFAQSIQGVNACYPDRFYVSQGTIIVFPDLTNTGAVDTRGKWQKILDEIDDMILETAGNPMEEVAIGRGTIAGQTLKGWDMERLVNFRDYALHMAGNEQRIKDIRGGAPNPRYKYAVMIGSGNGRAFNGFPDYPPFS